MECLYSEFCCGCLSRDRKMKLLNACCFNEEFYKIINEFSMQIMVSPLNICWECESRFRCFIKFKKQVRQSWVSLLEFFKEPLKPHPKSASNLSITNLEPYDSTQFVLKEKYKTTSPNSPLDVEIKVETFSDDDRSLLDIRREITEDTEEKSEDKPKKIITDNSFDDLLEDNKNVLELKDALKKNCEQHNGENLNLETADVFNETNELQKKIRKLKRRKGKKQKVKDEEEFVGFEKIDLTVEEILKDRLLLATKEEYANAMFKCEHCIVPFANEEDFKEHLQKKHSLVSKHKCPACTRCFPTASSLEQHSRRHSARWRCVVCGHLSSSTGAALTHYTRAHALPAGDIHDLAAKAYGNYENKSQENSEVRPKSTAQIPCERCPKTFRWRTSLRKHMETHNIESGQKRKPYCEPCNLSFTTTSNLKKHMQCSSKHQIQLKLRKLKDDPHNGETQAPDIDHIKSSINSQKEQFPCPQCDKKFQWKGNLWRHLQSHAARANGALVCAPCNRSFSSIATYKQHMEISRKHVTEDEFKYMCNECGKRFCNKIKLRDHIDWEHLNKYTHVCDECRKVFKSHTSLYLHRQVVHKLTNANHLCDHCGKSFPNKTKLRSHVSALHTKETPYKCTSCSARFSWHSCLSRHLKRVHRNKNATNT